MTVRTPIVTGLHSHEPLPDGDSVRGVVFTGGGITGDGSKVAPVSAAIAVGRNQLSLVNDSSNPPVPQLMSTPTYLAPHSTESLVYEYTPASWRAQIKQAERYDLSTGVHYTTAKVRLAQGWLVPLYITNEELRVWSGTAWDSRKRVTSVYQDAQLIMRRRVAVVTSTASGPQVIEDTSIGTQDMRVDTVSISFDWNAKTDLTEQTYNQSIPDSRVSGQGCVLRMLATVPVTGGIDAAVIDSAGIEAVVQLNYLPCRSDGTPIPYQIITGTPFTSGFKETLAMNVMITVVVAEVPTHTLEPKFMTMAPVARVAADDPGMPGIPVSAGTPPAAARITASCTLRVPMRGTIIPAQTTM